MRCASCGAEVADVSVVTCPNCGARLGSEEAEATARITSPTAEVKEGAATGGSGESNRPPRSGKGRSDDPFGPRRALYDFAYAARRALAAGGWFDAAAAAGVGFLALLCVGMVFLVAGRLQYPNLGADANVFSVFTSLVILALGSLRIPLHIGDLTVTALPFGALALAAIAVSWAVEPAIRRREVTRLRARVAAGAKIALPFGLLCCLAAMVFRFRGGATPTHADALSAFLLGTIWGTLFGALGGLRSHGSVRTSIRLVIARLRARGGTLFEGLSAGGWMLGFSFVSAAAAGLVWVIAALVRGTPVANFGIGDAFAGLVYIVAFLPNVIVAILAISFGAPLDVGAQITIGGRQIGPLRTVSLWDWGQGGTPWLAFALLLIPLIALAGAGFVARRNSTRPKRFVEVLVCGSAFFALVTSLLAWLGAARLGAGLVRSHGFAVIAADPLLVLVLAFAWALIAGFAGWRLADRRFKRATGAPESNTSEGEAA